jgi:hypothetical protein
MAISTPAASKVFDTFELLEKILLFVNSRTLLPAQRVNSTFRDLIAQSSSLQKKVFFKPVASIEEAQKLGLLDDGALVLAEPITTDEENDEAHAITTIVNELLFSRCEPCSCGVPKDLDWGKIDLSEATECTPPLIISKTLGTFPEHKRSWQRMIISQPPLPEPTITVPSSCYNGEFDDFDEDVHRSWIGYEPHMAVPGELSLREIGDRVQEATEDEAEVTNVDVKSRVSYDCGSDWEGSERNLTLIGWMRLMSLGGSSRFAYLAMHGGGWTAGG